MKPAKRWSSLLVIAGICLTAPGRAAGASPTIIADTLGDPPAFMINSFWGITPFIDRAYSFTVPAGAAITVSELETVAFHYPFQLGSSALFAIHEDAAGLPDGELVTFTTNDITTTEQVLSLAPSHAQVLAPATRYWLVGRTSAGQVNWSFGLNTFGEAAYRVDDAWTIVPRGNTSAFRLWGTAVPEPSAMLLAATYLPLALFRRSIGNGQRGVPSV
jgi:hypothetical protein